MPHWKQLLNPDYLGAYSLEPGTDKILTIKSIVREMITGTGGKKEECPVCHWHEQEKPMILNATNLKTIAKMYGNDYDQWIGKRVQIYVDHHVEAFGEIVDGLRIRKKLPEDVKIPCEVCGQMIAPAFNMSATQFAAWTKKRFGKTMCSECAQAEKAKQEEKTNEAES